MPTPTPSSNEYPDTEPEPWMCKARLRLKLLELLKADCDPNILDKDGESPSDYATMEGLWAQWGWALASSGWRYNEKENSRERK